WGADLPGLGFLSLVTKLWSTQGKVGGFFDSAGSSGGQYPVTANGCGVFSPHTLTLGCQLSPFSALGQGGALCLLCFGQFAHDFLPSRWRYKSDSGHHVKYNDALPTA